MSQRLLLLFAVFATLESFVLAPTLQLPMFSDDVVYIEQNHYVQGLSIAKVVAILDPFGEPARNTTNYAPVHLLAHAVEWSLWGRQVVGYHVVNVLLHALTSTLLVALLVSRGLAFGTGALAGLLFLLHAANVEAVAWIFQLKTILALGLAIAALWAHPRRPRLGLVLFALALLCKASALFAIPVAAGWTWLAGADRAVWQRRQHWLVGWVLVALAYAVPQLIVFRRAGELSASLHPELLVTARTLVAIGARYLTLAFTGEGVSPFHEPPPALSWLDPWWLAGCLLGGLLAWRLVVALRQGREEAAWWLWAVAGYVPISQILPFLYPMADRYLYFILPGLIGGTIFSIRDDLWPRVAAAARPVFSRLPSGLSPARAAAVAASGLAVAFGFQGHAQARIWRSPETIMLRVAVRYPDGMTAHLMRARKAALQGDAARTASELRGAAARGFDGFMDLQEDSDFAPILAAPEIDAVMREIAADWIQTTGSRSNLTYYDHYWLARAHLIRGELAEASADYEAALRLGGESNEKIQAELRTLRDYMAAHDEE